MDEKEILKLNIAEARKKLPEDTRVAIDSVDWRSVVLSMRETERFTFTQLEDLELETELLLCGLVSPNEYPKELERKMGISRAKSLELLDTLNKTIFKKIREVLEGKLASEKKVSSTYKLEPEMPKADISPEENSVLASAGIEIKSENEEKPIVIDKKLEVKPVVPTVQPEELPKESVTPPETQEVPSAPIKTPEIMAEKLSGVYQMKSTTTDHSSDNAKKTPELAAKPTIPSVDPYREIPE